MSFGNDLHKSLQFHIIFNIMLATLFVPLLLAENKEFFAEHVEYADIANDHLSAIPYCDDKPKNAVTPRLLYVSTLDGSVSAIDIAQGGELYWSIRTGPGSLISSNIHNLELTNSGQFVRMVPSLNGGIYKFDGESIDPIPLAMDNLLSTSAKFSDDLVISGGKEVRTYGISVRTGQVLYECSMNGCNNDSATTQDYSLAKTDQIVVDDLNVHDPLTDDVLVVRRQTQTVHAVDSRTGLQRWNFSVGQHQLDLSRSLQCNKHYSDNEHLQYFDVNIKVIVPEGIVCAFSKTNPSLLLWKQKFDHPVVNIWKYDPTNKLVIIDPFSSAATFWNSDPTKNMPIPSLYLGMYDNQLYIQESINLRKEIDDQIALQTRKQIDNKSYAPVKIPWHPFVANIPTNAIENINENDDNSKKLHIKDVMLYDSNKDNDSSAQWILNVSENVNGNGFYVFTNENLQKIKNFGMCQSIKSPSLDLNRNFKNLTPKTSSKGGSAGTTESDSHKNIDNLETAIKVIILSLCFWWKEMIVLILTCALLLHYLITQRGGEIREIVVIERHIPVPTAIEATESTVGVLDNTTYRFNTSIENNINNERTISQSSTNTTDSFCSRFQTDFDLMRCLGRGGFGVVFEAKNKLDDCKYAIKRIVLPSKEESRVRVMREVKTLANCEHQNIVRYFHSWVEKPPPGWQEEEDRKWLANEMSASMQSDVQLSTTERTDNTDKYGNQHLNHWWENPSKSTSNSSTNSDPFTKRTHFTDGIKSDSFYNNNNSSIPHCNTALITKSSVGKEYISIDLDSCSNCDNIHNCQLSSSFQIEFVGSANGKTHTENKAIYIESDVEPSLHSTSNNDSNSSNSNSNTSSSRQDSHNESKSNATNLTQNKVYLYIQMQLCRKESLREWLRDNNTTQRAESISSIFHQIVDAVDYVHVKGLIHRDLKPSNIFFSQDGKIKIGDFGLVTDMPEVTNSIDNDDDKPGLPSCARRTQQVGTHLYMSPEQLRGLHYDHKVDIYSLGLIFFELLVYFSTEMERIVTLKSLRDNIYPKEFAINHPKEYELLQKMLSAVPEERPSTFDLKLQLNDLLQIPKTLQVGDFTTSTNTISSITISPT